MLQNIITIQHHNIINSDNKVHMVKICNLAINKDKVINNLNLNNNLFNYNQSTTTSTTSDGSSSSSSSSTTTSSSTQTTSSTSGNLYTAGQCTWYVYDRVGGKIGSTWEMLITGRVQHQQLGTL